MNGKFRVVDAAADELSFMLLGAPTRMYISYRVF